MRSKMTQEREDYLVGQFLEGKILLDQVIFDGLDINEEDAPPTPEGDAHG